VADPFGMSTPGFTGAAFTVTDVASSAKAASSVVNHGSALGSDGFMRSRPAGTVTAGSGSAPPFTSPLGNANSVFARSSVTCTLPSSPSVAEDRTS